MRPFLETVTDLGSQRDALALRRHGVIEAVNGRFRRVLLRPFPKMVSIPEVLLARRLHKRRPGDRFLIYYDQPWRFRQFLCVKYIVSCRDTTYVTCCRGLEALDEIARIKGTDALLANVANWRISRRLLARWGWEPHCPSWWRRHYIKRFYGHYPARPTWLAGAGKETIGLAACGVS